MKLYLVYDDYEDMMQCKYLLCSYAYMKKRATKVMKQFIKEKGNDNFILDSGAFTFMNTANKISGEWLKSYIDEYCEFVRYYNITQYIEMDIDKVVGYEKVKEINKYIENKVGRKPLYVHHHETRTIEDLETASDNSDYIFWPALSKSANTIKETNAFVNFLYKKGVRCHLLGYSSTNLTKIKHLYSCDSASWLSATRFAQGIKYNNGNYSHFIFRGRIRDYKKARNYNYKEWLKYQNYLSTIEWKEEKDENVNII